MLQFITGAILGPLMRKLNRCSLLSGVSCLDTLICSSNMDHGIFNKLIYTGEIGCILYDCLIFNKLLDSISVLAYPVNIDFN